MKNSIGAKILEAFLEPKFRYKGVPVSLLGLPSFRKNFKKRSVSNQLARFKRKGFIEKDGEFLRITKMGREYIIRKQNSLHVFSSRLSESNSKNLIVMFDIPENKKAEREWFRFHLKKFCFVMIQKSVWVGPSPLPTDFLNYIKEIKLKSCVKTFKLAKAYNA